MEACVGTVPDLGVALVLEILGAMSDDATPAPAAAMTPGPEGLVNPVKSA
jgi:hypothetical protein